MKKIGLTVMLTAALGLGAFTLADAQGGRRGGFGPGGPGFGRGPMGIPGVELTDAQRTQIREILEQERPDGPPAHMTLHRQLRTELLADTPNDQKIESLREQLAQAQAEQLTHEIAVQRKIAQVLTAEQRARAREALANAPDGRGRRGREAGK